MLPKVLDQRLEVKACSFGNASITSFFPSKPLGCYGDGELYLLMTVKLMN